MIFLSVFNGNCGDRNDRTRYELLLILERLALTVNLTQLIQRQGSASAASVFSRFESLLCSGGKGFLNAVFQIAG